MRCTSPRTVGFRADGKTISWSQKLFSKEYATFQLPCGKCIECRLDYGRQWAVRCVHEAKMHPQNCFITLTYDDQHLRSPKLEYRDFQLFMKKLRKTQNDPIGVFVTGEYGEKTKRPHWHACLFNYAPRDSVYKYSNSRGDRIFSSESLTNIWGQGITEFGSVTFHSAGYCARYAAKKLVHGSDDDHDFDPISKKSSKNAIGKTWLEKNWQDVFNYGQLILPDGNSCSIPRYYEKWLAKHQPEAWLRYLSEIKPKKSAAAIAANDRDKISRGDSRITKHDARREITKQKFKLLQANLKL